MRKYYIIEFQNENLRAYEEIKAIKEAVSNCALSIFSKYDLRLQMPVIIAETYVVIEIGIPESKADNLVIGRSLRSISDYLVHHNDKYIGKPNSRLLLYREIPKPDFENNTLEMGDICRFELVALLIDLLKNNDSESIAKINKIKKILNA